MDRDELRRNAAAIATDPEASDSDREGGRLVLRLVTRCIELENENEALREQNSRLLRVRFEVPSA